MFRIEDVAALVRVLERRLTPDQLAHVAKLPEGVPLPDFVLAKLGDQEAPLEVWSAAFAMVGERHRR